MLSLALRLLLRDLRAGELRIMAVSLVVAVASFTTVAFFADRVQQALVRESSQLLGADLVLVSDRPIDARFAAEADRLDLRRTATARFPSMVRAGEASLLTEIKAVEAGYPLKGALRIVADGKPRTVQVAPPRGEAWADERLAARLGLQPGQAIVVGDASLRVTARIVDDPEASIGFLNAMPRLIVNADDLPATNLVQSGSRITYRLMVAGTQRSLAAFRTTAGPRVGPGQRLEDVRDARPEIRSALERAEKFLGLASLLSAVLASVAVALAARQYVRRHLDHCAMLRCLGASRRMTVGLHAVQLGALGLVAGVAGCLVGFAAQWALGALLAPIVQVPLPPPGWTSAAQGIAAGFVVLLGFALPPLAALGKVSTLRVLRRDLAAPTVGSWAGHAAGFVAIGALILWHTRDVGMAAWVLGGLAVAAIVSAAAAFVLVRFAARLGARAGFAWRFGLSNLSRRAAASVVQVVALGAGLLALILLSITRGDLLEGWRSSLPADAPNRFLVNVQPDQRAPLSAFFAEEGRAVPELYPMIRGRLVAVNGQEVTAASYREDRARRLVDREFNLSWVASPRLDNPIVDGAWWSGERPVPQFSVEAGIAETLRLKVGDVLAYDIAGTRLEAPVTSLRKVRWDSFRANFFVLAPPAALAEFPATFITSFHLPRGDDALMDRLVKRFPNILVIDVAAVLGQVQTMIEQVVRAVEFLFLFSLGAGLLVLLAALQTTHDERWREAALMRALGARSRQIALVQAAEFVVVGVLAGAFAASGASAIGWVLAREVLNVPYAIDPLVWVAGLVAGGVGVTAAGMLGTAGVLRARPMDVLRRA